MKQLVVGNCIKTYDKKTVAKAKLKKALCEVVSKCGDKKKVNKAEIKEQLCKAEIEYWEIYEEIWDSVPENGIETDEDRFDREMALMIADRFSFAKDSFTVGHSLLKFDTPNANKDCVAFEDRYKFLECMPGQACTYNHDQGLKIGSILNVAIYDPLKILLANARLWEGRPECNPYVSEARAEYDAIGTIPFSYEIYVNTAECSVCGRKFDYSDEKNYCQHLKTRMEPGSTAFRILRDIEPAGEAVVLGGERPAYKGSKTFVAASDEQIKELLQQLNDIENTLKGEK